MYNFWKFAIVVLVGVFCSILFLFDTYISLAALILISLASLFLLKRNRVFYLLLFLVCIDRYYLPILYKFKFYQLLLVVIVCYECVNFLISKKKFNFKLNILDISVLLVYFSKAFTIFYTVDYISSAQALLLNAIFLILYFYVRIKLQKNDALKVIDFMISTSVFFIAFGFVELIMGKFGMVRLQGAEEIYVYAGRPWSVFHEPDWFGGYLSYIIGLTFPLVAFRINKNYFKNVSIFIIALIMSLVIVVRSSWLGLICGALTVLIISKPKIKIPLLKSGLILALLLSVSLVGISLISHSSFRSINDRFFSIFSQVTNKPFDPAAKVRLSGFEKVISLIKANPISGYGVGAWQYFSWKYNYPNKSLSTNNIFLTPIFESGILGAACFSFFIFALLKLIFDLIYIKQSSLHSVYSMGIIICIIASITIAIFNDITLTGFYWTFLAIFNSYRDNLRSYNENTAHS